MGYFSQLLSNPPPPSQAVKTPTQEVLKSKVEGHLSTLPSPITPVGKGPNPVPSLICFFSFVRELSPVLSRWIPWGRGVPPGQQRLVERPGVQVGDESRGSNSIPISKHWRQWMP